MSDAEQLAIITTRIFQSDLDKLKADAERTGLKWQLRLRLLIHAALNGVVDPAAPDEESL